jgi:2TM domain
MENEILYRRAAVRATMQRAFYRHVMIYLVVVLLAALNLLKDPSHLWFQWGMLGWGIGLLVHGLNVYSYRWSGLLREQMIQRELERQGRMRSTE